MGLTYSANVGNNADVFPAVLDLYVEDGSIVADVTYGQGVFWRNVDLSRYDLRPTDLKDGVDFRSLPYEDGSIDALVLDPPYMHTPGGTAHAGHQGYEAYYRNNKASGYEDVKYHDAVLRLYMDGIEEARRVLRPQGRLIIKCQDQVCAGHFRMTSAELAHYLVETGWYLEDLIVLMARNKPGLSRLKGKQKHSRRNHSYFLVATLKPAPRLATRFSREHWPESGQNGPQNGPKG